MFNNPRTVFFRSNEYDIITAQRRLTMERGVSATREGEALLVQMSNGAKVRVALSSAKREARELSSVRPDLPGLRDCDAQFEISSEDPDHSDEVYFVAATLHYATQGYLFAVGTGEVSVAPEVWKLCSGPLTDGEIKEEIDAIVGLLLEAGVPLVLVSYGFRCQLEGLAQADGIPVATKMLSDFIRQSVERRIYPMLKADLKIQSAEGQLQFLLCHEADVHCSGADTKLVQIVRERWARLYGKSSEQDEREGTFMSLARATN